MVIGSKRVSQVIGIVDKSLLKINLSWLDDSHCRHEMLITKTMIC
jgi:hypothetical protein